MEDFNQKPILLRRSIYVLFMFVVNFKLALENSICTRDRYFNDNENWKDIPTTNFVIIGLCFRFGYASEEYVVVYLHR